MKVYVDSNVLLSYFKREFGGLTQAQTIYTESFLINCANNSHKITLSDLTFYEIQKNCYLNQKEVEEILSRLGIGLTLVETTKSDVKKAEEIGRMTGIHYPDSLHVRLAIKSRSSMIVTWDNDFQNVTRLIRVCKPSEFT